MKKFLKICALLLLLLLALLILYGCEQEEHSEGHSDRIYLSAIDENSDTAKAAVTAAENYIERTQYRSQGDLIASHSIVKAEASARAASFHINNILSGRARENTYNKDFATLYTADYLCENLVAVRTVQKLELADENFRLLLEDSGCDIYDGDKIDYTYIMLYERGHWQMLSAICVPYDTYDDCSAAELERIFADARDEIAAYDSLPPQKSEIDPESDFAKACLEERQREIVAEYERYPEVKSCRVTSCKINMNLTDSQIENYWNGGSYTNYMLAKSFLVTETYFELTFADDWDGKEGFGYVYGPHDVEITLPTLTLFSRDLVIYDPDGCRNFEKTESGWVRADGFPVEDVLPTDATCENMIFSENGKFGVRALDGTVFAPAEYDSASYGWNNYSSGFFVLTSGEDYYILQTDGEFLRTEPFDGVFVSEAGDYAHLLTLTANGSKYEYFVEKTGGAMILVDVDIPYIYPKPQNGWFFLRSFSDATRTNYGIVAPSGEVVIEPIYIYAKIPFPDRFILCEGESMLSADCFLSNLTDSTGKLLNNSFNDLEYIVFDDGAYFGVAYCGGEIADITAYTNGEPTPRGFWFVDKDGNTLSERFDIISGDFDYGKPIKKSGTVTVELDGDSHEYTAEEILEKYYK